MAIADTLETRILPDPNGSVNKLARTDTVAHNWYRFVLSYPPHLVRHYVNQFGLDDSSTLLDPFCGTGTTLVEGKKLGIASIGVEAHPITHFASHVKTSWDQNPEQLIEHANQIAEQTLERLDSQNIADRPGNPDDAARDLWGYDRLPEATAKLLLRGSISPRPLHKVLTLLRGINDAPDNPSLAYERLALAKALVYEIGNLHFGPEVGVTAPKADNAVVAPWLANLNQMAQDLEILHAIPSYKKPTQVHHADARDLASLLEPTSIDAVICSPPYPNEKDYTRTTRLETVLLGYAANRAELQAIKKGLVRSNTRTVYKDDVDDQYITMHPEIDRLANEIEQRRIELGKTSGFERMYPRVTRLYFGGMAKHLAELRVALKPGAQLAYVVGDQASFLRIMIRTGQLLAEIAERLGYEVVNLDLFRTRLATATREQLREEVVVLRWPGK